jgi:uncharacterized glyoxalase superfamily protein PhnB
MALTLLLKCTQLQETKAYYSGILEFEVSDTPERTCTVTKGGGSIIFTADDLWAGTPHCTGTIYFFLPDVDTYYDAIKNKALVEWPLQNMSYGTREFGVKDCNGYILAFARRVQV